MSAPIIATDDTDAIDAGIGDEEIGDGDRFADLRIGIRSLRPFLPSTKRAIVALCLGWTTAGVTTTGLQVVGTQPTTTDRDALDNWHEKRAILAFAGGDRLSQWATSVVGRVLDRIDTDVYHDERAKLHRRLRDEAERLVRENRDAIRELARALAINGGTLDIGDVRAVVFKHAPDALQPLESLDDAEVPPDHRPIWLSRPHARTDRDSRGGARGDRWTTRMAFAVGDDHPEQRRQPRLPTRGCHLVWRCHGKRRHCSSRGD